MTQKKCKFEQTGMRIRFLRTVLDINQTDFAKQIGAKRTTVANWENGTNHLPVQYAMIIGQIWGVGLNWIYLGQRDGKDDIMDKLYGDK